MTLLFIFAFCAVSALAQSTATAILTGVVTDPTQAVVPDAKITVTRKDTGITRETKSGPEGHYRVVLLPPGLYDIKAERPGFLAQIAKDVALTVGKIANIEGDLGITPQAHFYFDDHADWVRLGDDLPRFGSKTGIEPLSRKS